MQTNRLKVINIFLLLLTWNYSIGQKLFYEDYGRFGVTGAGFSTIGGCGNGNIQFFLEPGSIIKNAFFLP